MIARTNDDARLAVGVERRVVLARSDLVAKASMGMSCFGTMYTYLVHRSCPSLARIESDGDGLPLPSAHFSLLSLLPQASSH